MAIPPWQAMKGLGAEFNPCIMRMGGVVDMTGQDRKTTLGPHPTDSSKPFETVDCKAAVIAAKKAGVPNSKEEIRNLYNNFL